MDMLPEFHHSSSARFKTGTDNSELRDSRFLGFEKDTFLAPALDHSFGIEFAAIIVWFYIQDYYSILDNELGKGKRLPRFMAMYPSRTLNDLLFIRFSEEMKLMRLWDTVNFNQTPTRGALKGFAKLILRNALAPK